ncbi:MAG: KTSC domain-containing protein [Flavobacteriaceae bacterium]|nr:KTSC domain-containing protein [Flavobacteriaceae bacterium]
MYKNNEILEVEFKRGVYQYFDIPENVYDALMNADSRSVYFSANIRNDCEYQKM